MTAKMLTVALLLFSAALPSLYTQPQVPILRPRPEEVPILALRMCSGKPGKGCRAFGSLKTFNQVLWDDLSFSGFFTMAAKSFYPPRPIVRRLI